MYTLYTTSFCYFCTKVIREARGLGVDLSVKDITDPKALEELLTLGGRRQVPFLVDHKHSVTLYESDDIIRHLRTIVSQRSKEFVTGREV